MEPAENLSDWYLCRSKRFPGKSYLFNHKTGEAFWCLTDEDKNKTNSKNPEKTQDYPEPNHPPPEETMTADINPCCKKGTMSPHLQTYYTYTSSEIPSRPFNKSVAPNPGIVMSNAMFRSGPLLQPRCIPLSKYWAPTSTSSEIAIPLDALNQQTSSYFLNVRGNRNRVNNQFFEGRPKINLSMSEFSRMFTEHKKSEDINTSNNMTTSEEMRPTTSSISNLLSQDAYVGTSTEFNESFAPNPGTVMANDMFRSGPPLQPMYMSPSMYWTSTSTSLKTSIPPDRGNEQTGSHSLNVLGNSNRFNNQSFDERPKPNVPTSTMTHKFIRMLTDNKKKEDINTSNNMTSEERPMTSSTSNLLSQDNRLDVRTSTEENTTIINTSSDRAMAEEPLAYRQDKNCKCHIWDQLTLLLEKKPHCLKNMSNQDIVNAVLEVVEKKLAQSQDEGNYQNNTEENRIELETDNSRMTLAAKNLKSEHQFIDKPASVNKRVLFAFDRNEEDDSQDMTPYNMVTHQDQGLQEPASMSISQLKALKENFKHKMWLVVPDTEVLIFECDFLIQYVQSDEDCFLYIPYVVQADIMSICLKESRGQERITLARKVARRLETGHPRVHLQPRPRPNEDEAEETIISCCQFLINEHYHVILITDNSSLIKEANKIHCFKLKVIKDGAQENPSPIIIDVGKYETSEGNKSKVDKNVTIRNTNVKQQNNNDILKKKISIFDYQNFNNKTYEEFTKENKKVNQGNESHFTNTIEKSLQFQKKCGIMNDEDKDHKIIINHQRTNNINKNEVQYSNMCLKSHVKAHQSVTKNSNTIQENDIFTNHLVHETQKETEIENKSGGNNFIKINERILQNTNVSKIEKQKASEEKNNNKKFNMNSTEVTDYFKCQDLDKKSNKGADLAKMQNPNGNLKQTINSSQRQISRRNQFIHTHIDVQCLQGDIGKELEYYLVRFIITDEEILDRITKRIDEWVNWYTQAMENFFSDIILTHALKKTAIPTSLLEYLELVHVVLRDRGPVTTVINSLINFLICAFEKDTIKSNVDPNDFMKILGCSIFFLHILKKYKKCDTESTEISLKIMLRRIQDPETDLVLPQSPERINVVRSAGDKRRKTTSNLNCTPFKKPRSEIIKYLDKHLSYSLEEKKLETVMNELQTTRNIIRTIGTNLECLKLNSNQTISFQSVKAKPNFDIYMTKHENSFKPLEGGPKVIRNLVLIDKHENKFKNKKIKDMEHSANSRQVSNDSKNSSVDNLKMRFLDFNDNKYPKENTEHKMRVKKLTEEFELKKKNVTNQQVSSEFKNKKNDNKKSSVDTLQMRILDFSDNKDPKENTESKMRVKKFIELFELRKKNVTSQQVSSEFKNKKIKDIEHSASSRQVSNDSKNSSVDTLKMRFLDFSDNKDPKENTKHKMRVKKLTEEFELKKKNLTNQPIDHEPKNLISKQSICCGKTKTDTFTNNDDNTKISSNDNNKKTIDEFNFSSEKRSYGNKNYNNEKVSKHFCPNKRNSNEMDSVSDSVRDFSDSKKNYDSISNDRSDCGNSKYISSTEVSREKTSRPNYCGKKTNLLTEVLKGLKSTFLTIFEHIRDKKNNVNKADVQQVSRLHDTLDKIIVNIRNLILRESNEKTALYNFGDKVADHINLFTKFVDEAVILQEALATFLAVILGDFDLF